MLEPLPYFSLGVNDKELMETVAALSCIQMGYKKDHIRKAILLHIILTGNRRMSGVDIAKLCERIQDSNLIDKPVDHIAQTITPRPNNEEKISHKDKDTTAAIVKTDKSKTPHFNCSICSDYQEPIVCLAWQYLSYTSCGALSTPLQPVEKHKP